MDRRIGSDIGSDIDSDTGSDICSDVGSEIDSNTGSDVSSDIGSVRISVFYFRFRFLNGLETFGICLSFGCFWFRFRNF